MTLNAPVDTEASEVEEGTDNECERVAGADKSSAQRVGADESSAQRVGADESSAQRVGADESSAQSSEKVVDGEDSDEAQERRGVKSANGEQQQRQLQQTVEPACAQPPRGATEVGAIRIRDGPSACDPPSIRIRDDEPPPPGPTPRPPLSQKDRFRAFRSGVSEDPVAAYRECLALAKEDYPDAMYEVGKHLLTGGGSISSDDLPSELAQPCLWFEKAAAKHHKRAKQQLVECLLDGTGGAPMRDIYRAIGLLEELITAGDRVSLRRLILLRRRGLPNGALRPDPVDEMRLLIQADRDPRNIRSIFDLACRLHDGLATIGPADHQFRLSRWFQTPAWNAEFERLQVSKFCTADGKGLAPSAWLNRWKAAADAGDTPSCLRLGQYYLATDPQQQHGKPRDRVEAARCFRQGVANKDGHKLQSDCAYHLGLCLFAVDDDDDQQDLKGARDAFLQAAAQKHLRATSYLIQCVRHGAAGPQDSVVQLDDQAARIISLLQQAAEANDADSLHEWHLCCRDGCVPLGIAADPKQAQTLLEKAGRAGHADDAYDMACRYRDGVAGVDKDLVAATELFGIGADRGHGNCAYELGLLQKECGSGRALWTFRKGADVNHPGCLYYFGLYVEAGLGWYDSEKIPWVNGKPRRIFHYRFYSWDKTWLRVPENQLAQPSPLMAYQHFLRGAKLGHIACMHKVALYLRDGTGVQRDISGAVRFLKQVAAQRTQEDQEAQEAQETQEVAQEGQERRIQASYELADLYLCGLVTGESDLAQAAPYFAQAAEGKHQIAMWRWACCLRDGIGVDQADPTRAFEWFQRYAQEHKQGPYYHECMLAMGIALLDGVGVATADLRKAVACFHEIGVNEKARDCLIEAAKRFRDGRGVEVDLEEAAKCCESAVVAAGPLVERTPAAVIICDVAQRLRQEGRLEDAFRWFSVAARYDSAETIFETAQCHLHGRGCPPNLKEALELFYRGAMQHDHVECICEAAVRLRQGRGCPPDLAKARRLYEKGAELGHIGCIYEAACCFRDGVGVQPDPKVALRNFEKGAQQDHVECIFEAALCYRYGRGGSETDLTRASQQLRRVLQLRADHRGALRELGLLHLVEDRPDEAFRCFERASSLGCHEATLQAVRCLDQGIGVEKDPVAAFRHCEKVAWRSSDACYYLARFLFDGAGEAVQKDQDRAMQYLRMAALKDHPDALLMLGDASYHGTYGPQDRFQAWRCWREGFRLGHADCKDRLRRYHHGDAIDVMTYADLRSLHDHPLFCMCEKL